MDRVVMPSVPLHRPDMQRASECADPLPAMMQTPSGLALIEVQGAFALPNGDLLDDAMLTEAVSVGRLVFPLYDPTRHGDGHGDQDDTAWQKRVDLFIGHQRLPGEIKKLAKPVAVVRKKSAGEGESTDAESADSTVELEVMEIVKYKILFANRPEPIG